MIRPALLLLALAALALLGRLDRDGILAHSDAVAHALGVELRIEVTVRRACRVSPATAESAESAEFATCE